MFDVLGFDILGDDKILYQWDKDRKLSIPNGVSRVRFSNSTHGVSKDVDVVEGVSEIQIPPEILRLHGDLYVWGGDENNTNCDAHFIVIKSPKPADYVYTPEELKTWEELKRQIGDLEELKTEVKDDLVNAINEVLMFGENGGNAVPGEPGAPGVGISRIEQTTTSTADKGENVITITLTNGEQYTFSVFNGSKGSKGEDGYTPQKGKDYFDGDNGFSPIVEISETANGHIVKITDANGVKSFEVENGEPGYTPQKGIDYFDGNDYVLTETDIINIANKAIELFPVYEGEAEDIE